MTATSSFQSIGSLLSFVRPPEMAGGSPSSNDEPHANSSGSGGLGLLRGDLEGGDGNAVPDRRHGAPNGERRQLLMAPANAFCGIFQSIRRSESALLASSILSTPMAMVAL